MVEKDHTINQMRETIEILELKIKKLEQLVKLIMKSPSLVHRMMQ